MKTIKYEQNDEINYWKVYIIIEKTNFYKKFIFNSKIFFIYNKLSKYNWLKYNCLFIMINLSILYSEFFSSKIFNSNIHSCKLLKHVLQKKIKILWKWKI